MICKLQLTVGDICGDPTGLQVKVDEIDTHNRVHFSIVEEDQEHWTLRGEMSRDAFTHRFMRLHSAALKSASGESCNS